jgi:rubrerythrin
MDVELNSHEVFAIADKIERNGAKFYRRAAVMCDGSKIGKLFVELAQWEMRHVEVFRQMKEQLAERDWERGCYAPDRLDLPECRTLAGLAVFGIQPNPADQLTGHETKADILRMALEKEEDSIVFYTGLKDFVPGEANREVIADIIQEEMRHVRILVQSLEPLA